MTGYYGPTAMDALVFAIESFLEEVGDDPAYKEAGHKLQEVTRELDVLRASPGARAARRETPPAMSGQERHGES